PQFTIGAAPVWAAPLALAAFFLAGGALTSRRLRRVLVWGCAAAPLAFAGGQIVATSGNPPLAELFAERNGICALVPGQPPALIMSDLEGAPDQIFLNTVAPQLRRNVAAGAALVNLSSDYTTLAVSLMTLDSFPATRLYVSAGGARLLADELSRSDREGLASRCRTVGESALVADSVGLHLSRAAALLRSAGGVVLFVAEQIRASQLSGALGCLNSGSADGVAVVVAARPSRRLLDLLETVPVSGSVRLVFQRRNPQLALSEFGGAPVVYLTETGALRLRAPAESNR
ncbi:MAG TPA: hypothetical protein VLB27_06235, partial [candidate division Zixibacteria bacterium]|nr:hypothetical protein [candidate division Zixibacteria bacterium]